MQTALRILRGLPFALLAPFALLLSLAGLLLTDVFFLLFGRRRPLANVRPNTDAATVVIPNWNGRDLLQKYIPSVVAAMAGHPRNEILVVDNGSEDGSVEFLREHFPQVKVLALPRNLGFGGGSNAGFRAASNDIVVLLNSDMRVAPDFLEPLLAGFHDETVFAVACQIFFSDPNKVREETGLTQAWWAQGRLGVRHRLDPEITGLYPCFYPGGGSSAFDRRKFLELGGFDHLLRPFYLEDTDLGMEAWKRGWKVYYEPRSHVWHEHRGTIGRTHSRAYIDTIIQKNFLLFFWKNLHETRKLLVHFLRTGVDAWLAWLIGPSPERSNFGALFRAAGQLPGAMRARWQARSLATISDREAFRRPLGGYFQDRFGIHAPDPEPLSVLFLSPYTIYPPVHGGAVFMYGTTRALATRTRLHLVAVLDEEWQIAQHEPFTRLCASHHFLVRPDQKTFTFSGIQPHAVVEFAHPDLDWMIHRTLYQQRVDVLQIDYTNMGQYAGDYRNIAVALFEHDVYFQSIGRQLRQPGALLRKTSAGFEYLRALRYELRQLDRVDSIQTCSRENKEYLASFVPRAAAKMDETLRAGIDTTRYAFHPAPRQPYTMLFLGSFRHLPNQEALDWFARHVLPRVVAGCPEAKLVIIGSDPPPRHSLQASDRHIEIRGFVEDIQAALAGYAVFVCPILSGSGVRVKLLEAFCAGIPTVSTTLGAEGLARESGDICLLADDPAAFAAHILRLFERPEEALAMVHRARGYVTTERDITRMTEKLVESYREILRKKRGGAPPRGERVL